MVNEEDLIRSVREGRIAREAQADPAEHPSPMSVEPNKEDEVLARQRARVAERQRAAQAAQAAAPEERRPAPERRPSEERRPVREPAQRESRPARPAPPVAEPAEEDAPMRLFSREALMSKYWMWMGATAVLCWINSIGTTIVFVRWVAGIMFPALSNGITTTLGLSIAFGLFVGQLMNSTYVVIDRTTGQPVLLRNRRTAYRLLLIPDVLMTIWFWFIPILRPIHLMMSALIPNVFLLSFFSLFFAAAISGQLGVFSAQFPEKAATDPRLAFGERGRAFASGVLRLNRNAG